MGLLSGLGGFIMLIGVVACGLGIYEAYSLYNSPTLMSSFGSAPFVIAAVAAVVLIESVFLGYLGVKVDSIQKTLKSQETK